MSNRTHFNSPQPCEVIALISGVSVRAFGEWVCCVDALAGICCDTGRCKNTPVNYFMQTAGCIASITGVKGGLSHDDGHVYWLTGGLRSLFALETFVQIHQSCAERVTRICNPVIHKITNAGLLASNNFSNLWLCKLPALLNLSNDVFPVHALIIAINRYLGKRFIVFL